MSNQQETLSKSDREKLLGDIFVPIDRLEKVEDNLQHPDQFAAIFCSAAKTQKIIDTALKDIIKDLINTDKDVVECIKKYQKEVDKESLNSFLRKGGWLFMMGISFVLGTIVQALVSKYIGK